MNCPGTTDGTHVVKDQGILSDCKVCRNSQPPSGSKKEFRHFVCECGFVMHAICSETDDPGEGHPLPILS